MTLRIGNLQIEKPVILAPMAGITDWPFRQIARHCGAELCISEMVTAKTDLWHSKKSSTRLPSNLDPAPRPVQIAGSDPLQMAEAAKRCVDMGAGIIDINMGCPAKKVCNRAAGSALLADEPLVYQILQAVVSAVHVPVTLKTRTGTTPNNQNILQIAKNAENIGIQALGIHGRTRACRFTGIAEYSQITKVAAELTIPVIANGDIDSPEKAKHILDTTGASAVMIGRAAWGRPWLLGQICDYLETGRWHEPEESAKRDIIVQHLGMLYSYYGEDKGVQLARKHINWYLQDCDPSKAVRKQFNQLTRACSQLDLVNRYFSHHHCIIGEVA